MLLLSLSFPVVAWQHMGPFVLKASWCADLALANSKNGMGHANFMFGASVLEVPPKSMGIVVAQS